MNRKPDSHRPVPTLGIQSRSAGSSDRVRSPFAGVDLRSGLADMAGSDTSASIRVRSEVLDLAYEQYCQLLERGEPVDIESFCSRFPGLEDSVRRQIEIHHVIQDRPSLFQECCEVLWPQPGDELMGFQLLEEIGRGAFSRVFRAADTVLGDRQVVIKVCHGGAHEAWILGRLMHENIVPVFSSTPAMASGLSLICMPYLGRATLRDAITRVWAQGKCPQRAAELLPVHDVADPHAPAPADGEIAHFLQHGSFHEGVVHVGIQIAEALAYAHAQGILHLDLKPSNVLLDLSGRPRLLDFNLASDRRRGLPRLGGTLPYMSPEQVECFQNGAQTVELDGRADIFALGVVLHELLCGELPYERVGRSATIDELAELSRQSDIHDQMKFKWSGSGAGGRLEKIVQQCLALDPAERYQSAADLLADLRRELSLLQRTRRWMRKRRRTLLATAAAAFVLLAAMTTGLAMRKPFPARELDKGLHALQEEDLKRAEFHLTRSIEQQPTREAYVARGEVYLRMEDYHNAIRQLSAADEIQRDGRTCALIGYCMNMARSHMEAVGWYKRALEHGYATAGVYNNLGFSHGRCDQFYSAVQALDVAVNSGELPEIALRNRAIVLLAAAEKTGDIPYDALKDVDTLAASGDCGTESYLCAAEIYAYASSFDESYADKARELLETTIRLGIPADSIGQSAKLSSLVDGAAPGKRFCSSTSRREPTLRRYFVNPLR